MTMNTKPKGKRREKKTQNNASRTTAKSNVQSNPQSSMISVQGISLDPAEARKAIILSEIIGPPAAKRRRMR